MSRITYDTPAGLQPVVGDVLRAMSRRTAGPTGTLYVITAARRVRQRAPTPGKVRLALTVERIADSDVGWVHDLWWNPRRRAQV